MIAKTAANRTTEAVVEPFSRAPLSPWVHEILRDPLSKAPLTIREHYLTSDYGRRYPVVDGIYDLRLMTTKRGTSVNAWEDGQIEYERFAARERKSRLRSEYWAEQRNISEVYEVMPVLGRCVDVGGGDGRLRAFLSSDQEYLSVDPFLAMGSYQNRHQNLKEAYTFIADPFNFLCALGEFLPLSSEAFDTVHMRSVLDHLANTELALREAHRVLKRGGQLIVGLYVKGGKHSTETLNQRAKSIARELLAGIGLGRYKDHHLWHPTYAELCSVVEACGFSIHTTHWQKSERDTVCYVLAKK